LRDGWGGPADPVAARVWLQKGSALADAKLALADMLYFGVGGERRPVDALRWYELAARQSEDPYALYSVGYCLLYGQGTKADLRSGLKWLRRAADGGDADAHYELGLAYLNGNGTAQNMQAALKWLKAGAVLGHALARQRMAELEDNANQINQTNQ
jgi:TPR repeat protein